MRRKHTIENKEPSPPELTREEVISYLNTLAEPASIRQIAHGMELKHRGRRYLPRIIQQLKRSGEIEEVRGGRYRLTDTKHAMTATANRIAKSTLGQEEISHKLKPARDPNLISGRLVAHRDGYGFVVPDKPIPRVEGDLFIPPNNIED